MNNRKSTKGRRIQTVMSEPSRVFVESYTTKSGQKKNRYKKNPNAQPVKQVTHYPKGPEFGL